ncbi:MAG TPA: FAD:protein FMN transferase, partial [Longimicrobiales bacterium]|nr:FAD:protein FMN transferase [Longimicrobiales bacterium]
TESESLARQIADLAADEAWRVEGKFSRYRTDNVVHAINTSRGRTVSVDAETAHLIEFGATLWRLSKGAFDLTSGVLRRAWRFDGTGSVPSAEAIAQLMKQVGWQHVRWRNPELTLPEGMEIDLGGIGKEYAVDRVISTLGEFVNGPVLVNFGGDLRASAPPRAAPAWHVGIEAIDTAGTASRLVELRNGALATSGDTRRHVELNGQRYGHILDARTGWPTPRAPRSITVAADTCTQAGTFATLAMLRGENASRFLDRENVQYWCLR